MTVLIGALCAAGLSVSYTSNVFVENQAVAITEKPTGVPPVPGTNLVPDALGGQSMFCSFTPPAFKTPETNPPPECQRAPEQCIAFYSPLSSTGLDNPFGCFVGIRNECLGTESGTTPGVTHLKPSYETFFEAPATPFKKTSFDPEELPSYCILNANLSRAFSSLNTPLLTYQMAAYMAGLASTTDPAIISGISMLLSDTINVVRDGFTICKVEPGLFTGPSDLTFQLQGMPDHEFYIPGLAAPNPKQADTVQKRKLFQPGSYASTSVLNVEGPAGECADMLNIPVSRVFRKLGVNDESKDKKVPDNVWFDVNECMTTLNMCEDIALLERRCTPCNATETQTAPCSLYSNTVCAPISTVVPFLEVSPKLSAGTSRATAIWVVVIVLVIVLLAIVVVHFYRNSKEDSGQETQRDVSFRSNERTKLI